MLAVETGVVKVVSLSVGSLCFSSTQGAPFSTMTKSDAASNQKSLKTSGVIVTLTSQQVSQKASVCSF